MLASMLASYGSISVIDIRKVEDENVTWIDYEDLIYADWVIVAVPISETRKVLQQISAYLKEGSLVMDVCSVKVYPCRWMKEYLPSSVETLGTHPMFGPDSAKYGLSGLQIALCPINISQQSLDYIKRVFTSLKLNIKELSAQEHDKQIAKSLALVHFLGRAFNDIDVGDLDITTLGLERLKAVNETVNNDSWQLFLDMNTYNPYSDQVRHKFLSSLKYLNYKIEKGGK